LAHQTIVQFCCSGVTGAMTARMGGSAWLTEAPSGVEHRR
jgi:hypothetical protein